MERKKGLHISLGKDEGLLLDKPVIYNRGDIIAWGVKNNYPDILRSFYDDSSINQSILNTKDNYVNGSGIYTLNTDNALNKFLEKCNTPGDSLQEVIEKIIFDFLLYNGFAIQVQYTKGTGKIAGLYYAPFDKLRYNKDKSKLIHCEDWGGYRALNKQSYDVFNPSKKTGTQIYYYIGKRSKGPYPKPAYSGALDDIFASTQISRFHARKIKSGMFADLYIEMLGAEPTEEEKEEIEQKFNKKFASLEANHSNIFGYAENGDLGLRIEALPNADPEGKRFIDLRKSVTENIITAHQITSPSLLAIPNEGLSFGSEYQDVFTVFTNTYVNPTVNEILKPINKLLEINFPKPGIKIAPIPSLNVQLKDENIIVGNMTTEEVRKHLKKSGYIDNEIYTEGTLIKQLSPQQGAGVETAINNMIKKQTDAVKP